MYSVFVMWRAMVLDRLSQCRLEPEGRRLEPVLARNKTRNVQNPGYIVPAQEDPRSTLPRYVVPELGSSGSRYPKNQEPVVLGTPGT